MAGGRDHIGPYRLLRLIQVGNATHIWEAINSTDQRRVALKVPREEHAESRAEAAGLKHEFDVGSSLQHPNLIRFHELGYVRKVPYLVMEYFSAPNLKQFQRQNPERLIELMPRAIWQTLEALAHMHSRGWVHRDVKPENVLMDDTGLVKVIDFAIAQRVRKGLGRLFGSRGPVQGTRSYISPEQIRGEAVDPRSDIYSLGCTLFQMLTGRVPYTGTNADDLLMRHLKGAIPQTVAQNPEVTTEFSQWVASMMAKRADDRPATMQALLDTAKGLKLYKHQRGTLGDLK